MSIVIRGGVAQRLVVEAGDRVRASGRFVRCPDGDWLDLAQVSTLVFHARPWRSTRSFRLAGVDVEAVPDGSDQSVMAGQLCVTGLWRGDESIAVEAQEPIPWPLQTTPGPLFLGAAPAGGWDGAKESTDVEGLQQLLNSGQVVRAQWLRTDDGALILRVAATDVEAVGTVIAPQLPRRLHVVRSRYSAMQLREVEETFAAHSDDWGFESWSCSNLDRHGQPYAEVTLTRVNASLAAWADTLPDDLLILNPAMTPA